MHTTTTPGPSGSGKGGVRLQSYASAPSQPVMRVGVGVRLGLRGSPRGHLLGRQGVVLGERARARPVVRDPVGAAVTDPADDEQAG